jgi:hypothetical protein
MLRERNASRRDSVQEGAPRANQFTIDLRHISPIRAQRLRGDSCGLALTVQKTALLVAEAGMKKPPPVSKVARRCHKSARAYAEMGQPLCRE